MSPLLGLLVIVVSALAAVVLIVWLERTTGVVGLANVVTAVAMLGAAGYGFATGTRLLPTVFVIQAILFLANARSRRTSARSPGVGAAEA